MTDGESMNESDWIKGIAFSVTASVIGGASKLSIRKSWLMQHQVERDSSQPTVPDVEEQCDEAKEETLESPRRTSSIPRPTVLIRRGLSGDDDATFDTHWSSATQQHQQQEEEQQDDDSCTSRTGTTMSLSQAGIFILQEDHSDGYLKRRQRRVMRLAYLLRALGMMGMTFFNPLCCVLAMNYASPSILAPFSGLTLVWIVLFSSPTLGEKPSPMQVIASGFIVLGEVIVAMFGDHTNDNEKTLAHVRESYLDVPFLIYFGAMTAWMLLLTYWMQYSTSPFWKRFAFGVAGGSLTGLQNFLKDSLTILKATPKGHAYPWYLYLTIVLAMTTAFVGLVLLTLCMREYDATYSSAMFVGSFVVSASIMSAVHYRTFQHLEQLYDYILYPSGLLLLMIGVYILVLQTKNDTTSPATTLASNANSRMASTRSSSDQLSELVSGQKPRQRRANGYAKLPSKQ